MSVSRLNINRKLSTNNKPIIVSPFLGGYDISLTPFTLPETNSSHLKMGWLEYFLVSFWGLAYFQGLCQVSFREGKNPWLEASKPGSWESTSTILSLGPWEWLGEETVSQGSKKGKAWRSGHRNHKGESLNIQKSSKIQFVDGELRILFRPRWHQVFKTYTLNWIFSTNGRGEKGKIGCIIETTT